MMQEVYIVNLRKPWKSIDYKSVKIIIGPKRTWASYISGKCLIGSSAFYTEASAIRCKLALLLNITKSRFLKHKKPRVWDAANNELQRYNRTGKF